MLDKSSKFEANFESEATVADRHDKNAECFSDPEFFYFKCSSKRETMGYFTLHKFKTFKTLLKKCCQTDIYL